MLPHAVLTGQTVSAALLASPSLLPLLISQPEHSVAMDKPYLLDVAMFH